MAKESVFSNIRIRPRYIIMAFVLAFFILGGVYLSQQTKLRSIKESAAGLQSELDALNVEEERLERVEKIDPALRTRLSNRAVGLTLISNIFLAIIKTAIGIVGHSPALLADGINSTSDVVYNIVVSVFVRAAHKPADDEHPYGHTQFESVGALVVGAFVITTAITIFWNAINSLFDFINGTSDFSGSMTFTIYIALFTVLLKTLLSVYDDATGRKSKPLSIGGGTYARSFVNAVAFGIEPEDAPAECHMPDESCPVESIRFNTRVMAEAIKRLAGK